MAVDAGHHGDDERAPEEEASDDEGKDDKRHLTEYKAFLSRLSLQASSANWDRLLGSDDEERRKNVRKLASMSAMSKEDRAADFQERKRRKRKN